MEVPLFHILDKTFTSRYTHEFRDLQLAANGSLHSMYKHCVRKRDISDRGAYGPLANGPYSA